MNAARWVGVALIAMLTIGCTTGSSPSAGAAASGSPGPPVGTSLAPSAIPEAIVGTWITTVSEADLRAAGVTGQGELAENSGDFTMQLGRDGMWSITQVTDAAIRWPVFKGTSGATGLDSFQLVTTFPPDFDGDIVDFSWSLNDGALVLHVLTPPDPILPIVMETHPWQPKN